MQLSAGKLWGMRRMADAGGLFKMTAVDQSFRYSYSDFG